VDAGHKVVQTPPKAPISIPLARTLSLIAQYWLVTDSSVILAVN